MPSTPGIHDLATQLAPPASGAYTVPADRPHFAHWSHRLPRQLDVPENSLWFNLEVAARRHPNKTAYVFFGAELSFAELHHQAQTLAGWLQAQGVGTGDRVALFLQNCPQYIVAFYAVLRANAVVVPVNPMNRADEFGHYITDPDTKVVITSADLAPIVEQANAAVPEERRLRALLVTRLGDALPGRHSSAIRAELAPSPAIAAWLDADPPLPAAATRWDAALEGDWPLTPHSAGAGP